MSSDSELQLGQTMSRIPRPVPRQDARGRHRQPEDDSEDSPEAFSTTEPAVSRPLLYQPRNTRVCYFYRDGDSKSAPVKLVVNRRVYPTFDVLKDELTRRVEGLPFGVRGIYTPAGLDAVSSLADLRHDGRYVCTTGAAKARGVDVGQADAVGGQLWWPGGRPGSAGQRALNAVLRGDDDQSPRAAAGGRRDAPEGGPGERRFAWAVSDSEQSATSAPNSQFTSRSPKKIVVVRHGDTIQKQTLLLYKRTSQTFEQVLDDLSGMFKAPVSKMFTIDGVQVHSCVSRSYTARSYA